MGIIDERNTPPQNLDTTLIPEMPEEPKHTLKLEPMIFQNLNLQVDPISGQRISSLPVQSAPMVDLK